jgi:hypothetical protein
MSVADDLLAASDAGQRDYFDPIVLVSTPGSALCSEFPTAEAGGFSSRRRAPFGS